MTQTKVDNKWVEEKIIEILGLETAPDGQKNYLLTRNEHGQILEGVSFNSEVKELMNLLTQTQQDTLEWCLKEVHKIRGRAYPSEVFGRRLEVAPFLVRLRIKRELTETIKKKMEEK